MFERQVCYDIEVFPDYFCCAIDERVYRINDLHRLLSALSRKDTLYVGFNNLGYDNIVLAAAFYFKTHTSETPQRLKLISDYLIENRYPERSQYPNDEIVRNFIDRAIRTNTIFVKGKERRTHRLEKDFQWENITFCDLYMVGDKKGGLKKAAVVMDCDDLSECPIPFDKPHLTPEDIEIVDSYVRHDTKVTRGALKWHKSAIDVRNTMYEENGILNAYELGAAALSELYYRKRALDEMGSVFKRQLDSHAEWRKQSFGVIPTSSLIRCDRFQFNDKSIGRFVDLMYSTKFDVSRGEDTDYDVEDDKGKDNEPTPFVNADTIMTKGRLVFEDSRGHKYQFGAGGLHDIGEIGIWETNATHVVMNVDVGSYYPSLISSWRIHPWHFPSYADYIKEDLAVRLEAKKNPLLSGKAGVLKLAMNSSFGKMKDKYCSLYDPKAHFSVTLTGQIGILILIDEVYSACPSAQVINANTDGVCFHMDRNDLDMFNAVCAEWEKRMRVGLEFETYTKWVQKSCNLYCALRDDGKVKTKGVLFKLKPDSLGESLTMARAVKQMVVRNLLHGEKFVDVIKECEPKDFLLSLSFGGKTMLNVQGVDVPNRSAVRFVYSKYGSSIGRRMKESGKLMSICDGAKVFLVDDLTTLDMETIQMEWYIITARNIVDEIIQGNAKRLQENNGFFQFM